MNDHANFGCGIPDADYGSRMRYYYLATRFEQRTKIIVPAQQNNGNRSGGFSDMTREHKRTRRFARALAHRAGAIILGLGLGLIVCEVGLRVMGIGYPVFYRPDQYCGASLREGAEGWYRGETKNYIRISSQGLRDREHSVAKPAGTYRIAVLGDSFTEAFHVHPEEAFWSVMEREMAPAMAKEGRTVEVINFGRGGYGIAQELLTLRHRVWSFSPDLVILAFFAGNDVRNNSRLLNREDRIPYFVHGEGGLVLDDSFLAWYRSRQGPLAELYYSLLNYSRVLQAFKAGRYALARYEMLLQRRDLARSSGLDEFGLDSIVYREPRDENWKEAWSVTEDLLRTMNTEVTQHGASFLVVTLSTGDQVYPDSNRRKSLANQLEVADLFYPERRIKSLGKREGFAVLNLAPPLQSYADQTGIYLHGFGAQIGTGHWNKEGHRIAGILIAKTLLDKSLDPLENPLANPTKLAKPWARTDVKEGPFLLIRSVK